MVRTRTAEGETPSDIETLTFEQALAELEGIVKALESGQGALEASVAAYQRGAALRAHCEAGKPLLAECGGMLFCLDALRDRDGARAAMAGLLRGEATMQTRLAALGLQSVALPEGELRGHTFHYASAQVEPAALAASHNPNGGPSREAVYRERRLTASFVHFYFPSNPRAALALFLP